MIITEVVYKSIHIPVIHKYSYGFPYRIERGLGKSAEEIFYPNGYAQRPITMALSTMHSQNQNPIADPRDTFMGDLAKERSFKTNN